ncbi:metal ABC transporter permease [Miniphocaeibacter massiliensis]|uniref:metal ABC transporter permease n=1 Tax=Miniphocaeibacter massiliensis TaxID=2041841 RepID=UPI000C1BA93C|nr:metal ABC transporter permease [Miniphocaeibacter massiliensis]
MNIFQYNFMVKALVVGLIIAIIIPAIGTIVVNKRNSMVGDALSHTSLTGISLGLIIGINPIIGAIIVCIFAAFFMEFLRTKFPRGTDLSTAVIMSFGIGLAAVLSDFIPGSANLESFLFGSIVAISNTEMILVIVVAIIVITCYLLMYEGLIYITFDESSARLSGVPVKKINFIFTLLTALTIAIGSRVVGTLMISSLMILPVALAIRLAKSFNQTVLISVILGVLYVVTGILISFYLNIKPGGAIVLIGVIALVLDIIIKLIIKK